jgi:prepilin-type N-terminal cleavage/methylation domain-containing protein
VTVQSKRRAAYTLIEMLIVVAMMALAAAIVVPSLGSASVLRVQSTVRAIVADINFAQSDALARQEGRAIAFDTANNAYSIVELPRGVYDPTNNTTYSVSLTNSRKFGDSRITAAAFDGHAMLYFDELGGPVADPAGTTPSAGGSITVTGSGSVFRIDVEAYTGRVTVTKISGP